MKVEIQTEPTIDPKGEFWFDEFIILSSLEAIIDNGDPGNLIVNSGRVI